MSETKDDQDLLPVFRGTPEDWWDAAEEITESHAAERTYGDWYISKVRGSAGVAPAFRVATPGKPANENRRRQLEARVHDPISATVRRLIRVEVPVEPWLESEFVMADREEGSGERSPWRRKNSGRWQCLQDLRITVNDRQMAELNPRPATFSE